MLNDDDSDEQPNSPGLLGHQKDIELVRRVLNGDRSSFDTLVNDVLPVLHRFAASRLRSDPEVVRDVVQSTLCKVIENLSRYRGEGALLSWVCGICRFEILAIYKQRRRSPAIELVEESAEVEAALARVQPTPDPEQSLVGDEVRSTVHLTLDNLPSDYGKLLEMKYAEGCSVHEIAKALGLSAKAVESRLTRARVAFRDTYPSAVRGVTGKY